MATRTLVTGASAGIGLALVARFARDGHQVFGCARNITALQQLECEGKENVHAIACDITSEEQIKAMFEKINEKAGGLDICVNNAGMAKNDSLLEGSPDVWRQIFEVNVIGLCMVSQHAVSSMVKGGGDNCIVVNISSVLGFQKPIYHMPYRSVYIASKHAVNGVTASLRGELELAGLAHKIRVMSISPGLVETEFAARSSGAEKSKALYESTEPLKPEDVVESVVSAISMPKRAVLVDHVVWPVFGLRKSS